VGITPSRLRGQNFLIDASIADMLVDAAPLQQTDTVLEIGSGFGVITRRLRERVGKIIAVEADKKLALPLAEHYKEDPGVEVIPEDILTFLRWGHFEDFGYHLVSSLPYSITARVFRLFLSEVPRPLSITVLIQQEVAERVTAPAGKLSQLGLLAQLYARPEIVQAKISPQSFFPLPAVFSAIVRFSDIQGAARQRASWKCSEATLWKIVRAGFQNRRKMLKNTLANLPEIEGEAVQNWLEKQGYPHSARAQDIRPADWPLLAQYFFDE
jgi:16S rRNA (adenine1518-N6/adenine1519-N6)-dimethyltransferase